MFIITVSDIDVPDRHVLELPVKDALQLMGSEDNYEALISMFSFDSDGQLILKDLRAQEGLPASQSEKVLPKEFPPKEEKVREKTGERKQEVREVVKEASSPKQEASPEASFKPDTSIEASPVKPDPALHQQATPPPAANSRPASKGQPPAEGVEEVPESS